MSGHANAPFVLGVYPEVGNVTLDTLLGRGACQAARDFAGVTELGGLVEEESVIAGAGSIFESSVEGWVTLITLVGSVAPGAVGDCSIAVVAIGDGVVDELGSVNAAASSIIVWGRDCSGDHSTGGTVCSGNAGPAL